MQLILIPKLSFSKIIFTVFAIMLSSCSIEPKPTKSETVQTVLEEVRLTGIFLSEGKQSEAMASLQQTNNLISQYYKAKEDSKDTKSKVCNSMMLGDLRNIQKLYKYALSVEEFEGEAYAIGTIRDISVSQYGDCTLTKEIFEEFLVAKSLLLQHLDSIYPNDTETFEQRYYRTVDTWRIRETEAFTAWYSMDDTEKEQFEASASVRACLDTATQEGALGITLSDLQLACRQGLR